MPVIRIPGREPGGGAAPFSVSFDAAAAPGRALAGVGSAIQGVGEDLRTRQEERKRKEDSLNLIREQATFSVEVGAGLASLQSDLEKFALSSEYNEADYKTIRDTGFRDLYSGVIAKVKDPRLRAQFEGELEGRLKADLGAVFESNQRIRDEEAVFSAAEAFRKTLFLQKTDAGLRMSLGLFGEKLSEMLEERPELRPLIESSTNRGAQEFRAHMFAKGLDARYYNMLLNGQLTRGESGFPDNPVFSRDMEEALDHLEKGSIDLEERMRKGVSGSLKNPLSPGSFFSGYSTDLDALRVDDYLNIPGERGVAIQQRVLAAQAHAEDANEALNDVMQFMQGDADSFLPSQLNPTNAAAFARAWQEQGLPFMAGATKDAEGNPPSLQDRVDFTLHMIRDTPSIPSPVANTMRHAVDAARGGGSFNVGLFEATAHAFTIAGGNPLLVEASSASIQQQVRRGLLMEESKTAGLLDGDQVEFLGDYWAHRSAATDTVAAVVGARNSVGNRTQARISAKADSDFVEATFGIEGRSFRSVATEMIQKMQGGEYKDYEFRGEAGERNIALIRSFFDEEMKNSGGNVTVATNRTFNRFPVEVPARKLFGRTHFDKGIAEATRLHGTRALELEIVSSIASLPDRVDPSRPDFAEEKGRLDAIASNLDDPDFLKRLTPVVMASDPNRATIFIEPKSLLVPGQVPKVSDFIDGTLDDPATGFAMQIAINYEESEFRALEYTDQMIATQEKLSQLDRSFSRRLDPEIEPDPEDIVKKYDSVLAALDHAILLTPEEFAQRHFTRPKPEGSIDELLFIEEQRGPGRTSIRGLDEDIVRRFAEMVQAKPDQPLYRLDPELNAAFELAYATARREARDAVSRRSDRGGGSNFGPPTPAPSESAAYRRRGEAAVLAKWAERNKRKSASKRYQALLRMQLPEEDPRVTDQRR